MSESLKNQCAPKADPDDDIVRAGGATPCFPGSGRRRTRRGWPAFAAVFIVVLLAAFAAAAQSAATKGLSGPTLRLFKAIELNDMAAVKGSLDDGADISMQNADGQTAADLAVDKGHFIIAHYLLSRRLLGQTEPVMLAPGKTEPPAQSTAAAKPKPSFAPPPGKPKAPAPVVAQKPGAPPEVAEAPKPAPPPSAAQAEPGKAEPVAEGAPKVAPEAQPGAQPGAIAEQGIASFFKSLVELVTPGGEQPGEVAQAKEAPGKAAKPPSTAAKAREKAAQAEPSAKGAGETKAKEPDEIVVDIAGPASKAGGAIEEIKEIPAAKAGDAHLETITAETAPPKAVKKDTAIEEKAQKAADKPAKDAAKTKAKTAPKEEKAEKPAPSIIDRMAELFQADKKTDQPEAKPKAAAPPAAKAAPTAALPVAPAVPAQPPAKGAPTQAPGPAGPGAVATYDLPLPTPLPGAAKKFSPKFLDRLADFLESGDEAAFKAWLPEMQLTNPSQPSPERQTAMATPGQARPDAAKIAVAPLPAPEKPAPATQPKPPIAVAIVTGEPDVSPLDAMEADLAGIAGEGPPTVMVAAPSTAPTQATAQAQPQSVPADKPGGIKGAFNKLMSAIRPGSGDKDDSGRMVLAPEEKLAGADQKAGAAPPAGEVQKVWPVTGVEPAKTPLIAMMPRISDSLLKTSLTGVTLAIGESVSLESSFPPGADGSDPSNQCVKKNRGTTLFCLEPVDWPARMQADFLVPTILYTGHKAIARFDQGIASRLHALFPADAFPRVVAYFRDRYGDPTDSWNRGIAPFAQPRQDNPTLAWRSVDPKTGAISVLEVRKYDDTRGGFPDTNRGAVMLYLANSPPIFPQVSTHELMRLTRTSMGAPSAEPNKLGLPPADAAGAQPDLSLPGAEPGAQPDLSLPEPAAEPAAEPAPGGKPQAGGTDKTEKQLKDDARAKRRAEREAKRAAGAAKQAAGAAQQEIGAKRATQGKAPAVPAKPADNSLDLPPEPRGQ